MVTKQFRTEQFENVCGILRSKGSMEPMDSFYTVTTSYEDVDYLLRVQRAKERRLVVILGLRRDTQGYCLWEPIQRSSLLLALLEMIIAKGID